MCEIFRVNIAAMGLVKHQRQSIALRIITLENTWSVDGWGGHGLSFISQIFVISFTP